MPSRTANKPAVAGYVHKGTYHGISEYELTKNGLRVLHHHDPTTPVVGFMVTYLVGSRHEGVGYTGSTHILEHLMFKGSKKFPPRHGHSVLDKLDSLGAQVNASTWFDRTNYYEVVPKEHLSFAMELEADRMRNAIISKPLFDNEMPAVRSEFAMYENDAHEKLDQHLWATAYHAHPYHHSTIGWLSDIENVPIERLKEFYDTFYWPNNAVVTIVGDIEVRDALIMIKRYFGVHPRSPQRIPETYTAEPAQTGRRTVEVVRSGEQQILGLAFKVPEGLHADTPALSLLVAVLADGQNSRLYKALVKKGLASSVRSSYYPFRDPGLMTFFVTLAEGVSHEKVEQIVWRVIDELIEKGVDAKELARAVAQEQTDIATARDGHYALLSALNEAIALGSWRFFFDLPRTLARIRISDIKRVARTYITPRGLSVGYYKSAA